MRSIDADALKDKFAVPGYEYFSPGYIRDLIDEEPTIRPDEPRVMTLIEWIKAPEPADGECMCYEIKDKGLQAMLVKAFDGVRHLYGKAFRVWTSRPTDEQRKAVKWE